MGEVDEHRWRRRTLLGVGFVGLILLMLRPSWHDMTHTVTDLGDPVLYGWTWNWTRHALFSSPLHLFDGNIFYRHELTVAYTDNMLVLLAPFSVLRALGAGWAFELNVLTLGLMFTSLAATFGLARRITGRTDAAMFAAIGYTFSSFAFVHQTHLQLLLLGQFPIGFLLAFRWLERRRARDAIWFGLVNASFFLGALYYAAIWMVCVAVVLIGTLIATRFRPGPRFWSGLVVVGVFSATAIQFVLPYLELDQTRPLVKEWGLQPRDFAIVAPGSYLYPGLDSWSNRSVSRGEHSFFPGFSTELFAVVGAVAFVGGGLRRRRGSGADPDPLLPPARRRELWLVATAGAAAFVLAFGPEVRGRRMPFAWFHDNVPGFAGIRVSDRLAMPGMLALSILAAVGVAAVVSRIRAPRLTAVAVTGLCAFLLLELAAPISRSVLPDDRATLAVYRALEHRPDGAVAELPMIDPALPYEWAHIESPRMLYGTLDLHPRVNGYSGSWPDDYRGRVDTFATFPARPAVALARRLGVRYVVLHIGVYSGVRQFTEQQARTIVATLPRGASARRYGDAWLVDLRRVR
ncbi:MAG: hypothetical protein ACXVJX_15310 [Acidimicrobiia bacterium]